jgi:DNA-binding GntR family transcriptional regulator
LTASRATLAQLVADTLRSAIRSGTYLSGERLIELAIAQSQNVSQNTVRDALRQLEAEGWVRYEPRRGVRVRRFDPGEAEEIFALMAAVERLALEWAFAELSRAALLAALTPPLEDAREYHALGQIAERRDALFAFHAALGALADRPQTRQMLAALHNQALLLTANYEMRASSLIHHSTQIESYEHLLGVLKFGTLDQAADALHARILADGKPVIRWLALNT